MALLPLFVMLPLLKTSKGIAFLISSEFVETLPPEWAHYVAAKSALEATWNVLQKEHPDVLFMTIQPPQLLTDQTNSFMGRHRHLPAEIVSEQIAEKIISRKSS